MTTNEILWALAGLAIGWILHKPAGCSCPQEPPKSVGDMVSAGAVVCKRC